MSDPSYKLDELARAAGTSARTVRYYVQRGLIPAPSFRGKDTAYGRDHLARLRAIRKLQDAFFPLDAIAVELDRRTVDEIERIADGGDLPAHAVATSVVPATPRKVEARVFQRIEIAPGVELSIADDAPEASRSVADKILRELGK